MKKAIVMCGVLAVLLGSAPVLGDLITYYGDDDGFGVGAFSGTMNPDTSHVGAGEAAYTDMRLIGDGFVQYGRPAFVPTGNFGSFSVSGEIITNAVLTLRTGSFDSSPALDAPNRIYLDGMLVNSSFIDGFSTANVGNVETRSYSLPSSFFPLLADGIVSLDGTHISEASGSGSFQVDFLSLDITTEVVPVPGAVLLGLLGLSVAGVKLRKRA